MVISTNKDRGRASREVAEWCAGFDRLCRERGIRITAQRTAVYQALAEDTTHPTAECVYDRLRRRMSSLSFATVYRILECLESKGLIRRFTATNGVNRYDANLARHHHLVCRVCNSIVDFEDETLSNVKLPRSRPAGFTAEELEIRVMGTCEVCRRSRSKRSRSTSGRKPGKSGIQ